MKHKFEASDLLKKFFAYVKTQFGKNIKAQISNNKKEFALDPFFQEQGVRSSFFYFRAK